MFYFDITFLDNCLWTDDAMEQQEQRIHEALFPAIEFSLQAFCKARQLPLEAERIPRAWRNAKCDVQALWTHIYHQRNVFVTSDKNFHSTTKRAALISLGAGAIAHPDEAAALAT